MPYSHKGTHSISVAALYQPAVEEDLPNCDWINLETNGPRPVAMSVVQQKAQVFSMKVLLVRMAFVAGKISFSRPWMCSSFGGKSPSLIAAIRRSRAPGISLGYPRRAIEVHSSRSPPKKYPSHQAPIQRGSSGVKSTPGGWKLKETVPQA